MSARQLIRLAVAFGVLLVIWGAAALSRRHHGGPDARDRFRLPPISRAKTDTVVIARQGKTSVLARRDSLAWTVERQPAAPQAITDLFEALGDSGAQSELVAERQESHADLGVDSAGIRVEVKEGSRTVADLVVGRRSPDLSGGYVRRRDEAETYLVRGRLVEVLSRPGDEWRDRLIAAVPAESVAAVEISRRDRRYSLRRGEHGWTLGPRIRLDSARAAELVAAYRTVEASGFATPAQADSARFTRPDRKARLLRKDGTPLLALLFDSTATGFWVRPDTGKAVYRIDSWTADRLTPADTTLRARKSPSK